LTPLSVRKLGLAKKMDKKHHIATEQMFEENFKGSLSKRSGLKQYSHAYGA
jgi:hypothetical protein